MRSILSVFLLMGAALAGPAAAADGNQSAPPSSAPATPPDSSSGTAGQPQDRPSAGTGGTASERHYAPDNSGKNRQHEIQLEAEDQSNAEADIDLTAKIRRALTDDASLSTNAHNVKVITSAGRVTLRGPVASETERRKVEAIAKKAAGSRPVVNQLEVSKN